MFAIPAILPLMVAVFGVAPETARDLDLNIDYSRPHHWRRFRMVVAFLQFVAGRVGTEAPSFLDSDPGAQTRRLMNVRAP